MFVKNSTLLCFAIAPFVEGFRSHENTPKNLKLPTVKPHVPNAPLPVEKIAKLTTSRQDLLLVKPQGATERKRWGIDKVHENEYWNDERIHTLGNVGFGGAVHAALAPFSTKLIDVLAYNGTDVRQLVADELAYKVSTSKARVLDLCCGVGISTRALQNAFPEAETVVGMDTSSEMISMAQFLSHYLASAIKLFAQGFNNKYSTCSATTTFSCGNAESTHLPTRSFDLVTIMYAFHEAPKEGRHRILLEARRLLAPGGTLAVIDICADYQPSETMLAGEPYVLEYQKHIHDQLRTFRGFAKVTYKTIIPSHVGMWVLKRSTTTVI